MRQTSRSDGQETAGEANAGAQNFKPNYRPAQLHRIIWHRAGLLLSGRVGFPAGGPSQTDERGESPPTRDFQAEEAHFGSWLEPELWANEAKLRRDTSRTASSAGRSAKLLAEVSFGDVVDPSQELSLVSCSVI